MLRLVASAIVNELKKINQNIAALSVASSIMDRLSYLLSSTRPELGVGPGRSVDRWALFSLPLYRKSGRFFCFLSIVHGSSAPMQTRVNLGGNTGDASREQIHFCLWLKWMDTLKEILELEELFVRLIEMFQSVKLDCFLDKWTSALKSSGIF